MKIFKTILIIIIIINICKCLLLKSDNSYISSATPFQKYCSNVAVTCGEMIPGFR